jgi:hypothetical protein
MVARGDVPPDIVGPNKRIRQMLDLHKCTSRRTPEDGSLLGIIPGNKLPGYDHLVPTGHSARLLKSFFNSLLEAIVKRRFTASGDLAPFSVVKD